MCVDQPAHSLREGTKLSDANLEKIIHRVNSLLKKAESTQFPEEKAACEAKAEELIQKHRLEQENLLAIDEKTVSPVVRTFPVGRWNSEFRNWMWSLFLQVADHCEVKVTYEWSSRNNLEELYFDGLAVGYEIDLRYMELLWSSIRLTFISKLEPKVDPALSEEENIYNLRQAGIARKDVAVKIWGHWTHANSAKVGRIYKDECAKRGEAPALDGKGIHLKTFREVYTREFYWKVTDRLRAARDASMSQGGAMVFADRKQRVEDAFYLHFPHLKPKPVDTTPICEEPPTEDAKKARKRLAYHETAAYRKKQQRMYNSPAALAGASAGMAAGEEVNLSRVADRTERLGHESPANDTTEMKEMGR